MRNEAQTPSQTEEPTTEQPEEEEVVLALERAVTALRRRKGSQGGGIVRPAPVPFDDKPRPGWQADPSTKDPICYNCYVKVHYSNDCRASIADFEKIVANFLSLTPDERARVPDKSYKLACRLVDPSKIDHSILDSLDQPKN